MLHNKKKMVKLIIAVILVISIMTVIAIAINSKINKSADNDFNPAEVGIAVQENGDDNTQPTKSVDMSFTDPDSDSDKYEVEKRVEIMNVDQSKVNNTSSYVRVCIIPQFMKTNTSAAPDGSMQKYDVVIGSEGFDLLNAEAIGPQLEMGNVVSIDGIELKLVDNWHENWRYGADGYFYYVPVLAPGQKTTPLLEKVTMNKEYAATLAPGTWLRVTVSADSIQAEGNESKDPLDRWK